MAEEEEKIETSDVKAKVGGILALFRRISSDETLSVDDRET